MPSPFIVPEHLFVPQDIARHLAVLLGPGRAQARSNGYLETNGRLTAWLMELDRAVDAGRGAPVAGAVVEQPQRFISTAEAARRLGVSERRVRDMRLTGRKVAGAWQWLADDVDLEASVRADALFTAPS